MKLGVVWFVAALFAAGCSSTISAADYDQSCVVEADCVAVAEGEACALDGCACRTAAVNVDAEAQYSADFAVLACLTPSLVTDECLCRLSAPACVDGRCAVPGPEVGFP